MLVVSYDMLILLNHCWHTSSKVVSTHPRQNGHPRPPKRNPVALKRRSSPLLDVVVGRHADTDCQCNNTFLYLSPSRTCVRRLCSNSVLHQQLTPVRASDHSMKKRPPPSPLLS